MKDGTPRFLIESIVEDVVFFVRLFKALAAHPESSLWSPPTMPIGSLFVIESYGRLSEYSVISKESLSEAALAVIRPARHRAKLLLSSTKDVSTLVCDFDRIVREEREAFVGIHTGWLAPFKRFIQPDLGLSLCDGHIFTTTHGTRFLFGADAHEPERLREAAFLVSSYCAKLADAFASFAGRPTDIKPFVTPPSLNVVMKDIKCESLYHRGALGKLPLAWAGIAAMVLANVNLVHRVLRKLVPPGSRTFLKIRLMYAFHAIHSLRLVQDYLVSEKALPESAASVLARSLGHADVRWLKKRDDLRDTLVHYQPGRVPPAIVGLSYQELLSKSCGNRDHADLEKIADAVLEHFSTTLRAGFNLTPATFWYAAVPPDEKAG